VFSQQNLAGNESHKRSTLAVQQGQFTALSGGRGGGRFGSVRGDFGRESHFGGSTRDFGRGDHFGGSRGILVAETGMVAKEILIGK